MPNPLDFLAEAIATPLNAATNFAEGLNVSLNQVAGQAGGLADNVLKVKNTIDAITGKSENKTAQQIATKQSALDGVLSPQAQNILIVVGIMAGGLGLVYLVRKVA